MSSSELLQFINCRILRNHKLITEDLWVRSGKIVNPEKVFFDEAIQSTRKVDCKGAIVTPGFIEIQINGAFGIDFSNNLTNIEAGVLKVAKGILAHGVTSFCPTIVTSPKDVYKEVLSKIKKQDGGKHGATILGIHVEGPFINVEKKGAHPLNCIQGFSQGFDSVLNTYSYLDNVKIITIAPELDRSDEVIKELAARGIVVSLGHSMGSLKDGERAVQNGASLITHLFNAMLPFHHRDPGLVGLLASKRLPEDKTVYYGIIADGVHTHPAALRIAHRIHSDGMILVTDAISAMGLPSGKHNIGLLAIEIRDDKAYIAGTETLCGSIASLNSCVRLFHEATGCSIEYALETVSLHPALALGIADRKGALDFGADADFIMIDEDINVLSTWIAGECVYDKNS